MSQEFLSRASPHAHSFDDGDAPAPLWAVVWGHRAFSDWEVCFISAGKGESQRFQLKLTFGDFCKEFSSSRHTSTLSR